jgi:eukaryotic-like serine/threonine-protein kinase
VSSLDEVPPPSSSATVPLGLGEVLAGKYRVERLLGAGGMGLVVLATHIELDQLVAIKMMREEGLRSSDARARFAREAKAAVRLKGEHVARVIDVGANEDGAPFLVMEYLQGQDLATVLDERGGGGLPIDEAVAYLLQVCEAVAEAHGLGIVHRDLKPRNVFVTTGVDGKPLVKVLDFGISKIIPPAGATADMALTRTTDVMGSPSYMAPEQLRAARDADERADIWSLGVILYEIVTGRLPWEADSVTELGAMVLRDDPRPMRALREGVPPGLEDVMLKCLAKERSKRYASVVELAHALEPHALGLADGSAERITSVARTSKQPPGVAPSLRDRPSSSSSRVIVSGGTSVSWGETELQTAKPSIAPGLRSRSAMLGGALLVIALAASAYALGRRDVTTSAPPLVLPEDRGAIRPPATASVALPTSPAPTALTAATATAPQGPEATSVPASIASIPRRAPTASGLPRSAQPPSTAQPAAPSSAKPPDAHDMGSIPRK